MKLLCWIGLHLWVYKPHLGLLEWRRCGRCDKYQERMLLAPWPRYWSTRKNRREAPDER